MELSLDDFIIEHLKKAKNEKTLKFFEGKMGGPKQNKNVYEKFMNYLKKKESEKENEKDDLGFEINFGAYQSEAKVSFTSAGKQISP